ncbi:hypothetical protein RJ640_009757 [Escallonia rubra]|uniref:CCHC-type domain-containing protein n=1 Tax=Escallonia rubra TaxID=112253 RepID=A0AA88RBA7_9ASTE|nr:hypothetical protein RJ640_009757 [Escallonia rubra]
MGGTVLWNVMVDGFVRNGDFRLVRELFDEMPQRSVVSWNSMISGYAQNGLFNEAIELFRDMQMGDTRPNYVTLVSVLPAISRLGALELGKWVHLYAERNGIGIDEVLGSALIDMYSKCGSIDKVLQLFESLSQKNVITWNAILRGHAMHGRGKDAVDFFSKMQQAGVGPSEVTYISVLSAYSHAVEMLTMGEKDTYHHKSDENSDFQASSDQESDEFMLDNTSNKSNKKASNHSIELNNIDGDINSSSSSSNHNSDHEDTCHDCNSKIDYYKAILDMNGLSINVITSEESIILDLLDKIDDPEKKKQVIFKYLHGKQNHSIPNTSRRSPAIGNTFNFSTVMDRLQVVENKGPAIQDLQGKILSLKKDVKTLSTRISLLELRNIEDVRSKEEELYLNDNNVLKIDSDFIKDTNIPSPPEPKDHEIFNIDRVIFQKWYVSIKVIVNKDFTYLKVPSPKNINMIGDLGSESESDPDKIEQQFITAIGTTNLRHPLRNYYPRPTPVDMQLEEKIFSTPYSFNGSSIYEWNLDGMTDYQVITLLQHMLMAANSACNRNTGENKATIARYLITGFTGQLRGWWDFYLTPTDQNNILNSIKIEPNGTPILVNEQPLSYAVTTLVTAITKHFIGTASTVLERGRELLINLRCHTLTHFRWYKDVFLSKLYQKSNAQQDFWKERFIAGLPNLFSERVRSRIKNKHNGALPFSLYTFGALISEICAEGLVLCNDIKLKNQLKKEHKSGRTELGKFCYQFGYDNLSVPNYGTKEKTTKPRKPFKKSRFPKKYKKEESSKPFKRFLKKKFFSKSKIICHKCGKPGHYANKCYTKQKINELVIDEGLRKQLSAILLNPSDSEEDHSIKLNNIDGDINSSSSSSNHNSDYEDTCHDCNSKMDYYKVILDMNGLSINVITSGESIILDLLDKIDDPEKKKQVIFKYLHGKQNPSIPNTSRQSPAIGNTFNFSTVMDRLQVVENKRIDSEFIKDTNISSPLEPKDHEILNIDRVIFQKWYMSIKVVVNKDFTYEGIALIDFGAYLNCIKEGLIKLRAETLPCLCLPLPEAFKIVETDASDIGYGGKMTPPRTNLQVSGKGLRPCVEMLTMGEKDTYHHKSDEDSNFQASSDQESDEFMLDNTSNKSNQKASSSKDLKSKQIEHFPPL